MAKLNGVKTVDMVNGEVTKIVYEGEEYAKVATGFAQAQSGDLFLSQGQYRETFGAFYEIKIVENGDNHPIRFVDDEGRDNGYMRNAPHLDLFRKISADKPTLEQRVGALESDVAALKGEKKSEETIEFEGATYRKVDREAREGDVFIVKEDNGTLPKWFTVGKPYKALAPSEKEPDKATVIADDGDDLNVYHEGCGRTRETVDVYEPIEQAKKEASEPKLKAGDYVKFKRSISDTKANKPYLIEYYAERGELAFRDDAGDWCSIAHTGEYEILSAEEAKWAKIGRKPNEFKKGDVVRVVDNMGVSVPIGSLATITHDQIDDKPKAKAVSTRNGDLRSFWLGVELITPVESLFNNA